ncbi:hypothetical protein IAD21_00600 [Abditibacteriota bacterium]|nr:hypothetical protein IAD21_00600 [Abditibacteriota bacterium]
MHTLYRLVFWGLLAVPIALATWLCYPIFKVPQLPSITFGDAE